MAVVTRRFEVIREQSVLDDDGQDRGNAHNTAAATGRYNAQTQIVRDLMLAPFDLGTDVYQIKGARLWVYGQGEAIFAGTTLDGLPSGTGPQIRVRPLATDFNSGGGTEDVWQLIANANWATQPALDTGSPTVTRSISTGIGPRSLDVAALVEYHAPARILNRSGAACGGAVNHGWRLSSPNEAAVVNNAIFATIRHTVADRRPYLEIDVEVNSPPLVPTIETPVPSGSRDSPPTLVPTGGMGGGREVTVVFNFRDPEDALAGAAQLQVLPDGATDLVPGTPIAGTGWVTEGAGLTKLGTSGQYSVRVAGLPRPHLDAAWGPWRIRLRTRDPKGMVGPWTSVDTGRIQTAYIVGAPVSASMQTKPDHPRVFGTINSPAGLYHAVTNPGGDYVTGWQGEFYRVTGQGSVNLWPSLSSPIGIGGNPTRSEVPYDGLSLNDGDVVTWRQRHVNRDGVLGLWSAYAETTIRLPTGPTFDPADTGTKLTSRTAEVEIVFDVTSDGYHSFLYRGGVQIHDSGTLTIVPAASVTVTLPEGKVGWGDLLEIEAQSRPEDDDVFGPLSGRSGLQVDTLPSTETHLGDGEVEDVPVVGTTDIVIRTPYLDPDVQRYGEAPTAKEIEIRVAATPAGSGALLQRRTRVADITDEESLEPDLTIAVETSIDVRARYRDDADPKAVFTLAAAVNAGAQNILYNAPTVGTIEVGDEVSLGETDNNHGTRTVTFVGTAGAGGTGLDVSESYGFAHPSGASAYVYPWGSWSGWATIKGSVDPVVVAVSPLGGALIEDPRPELIHTYDSIKAQAYRTVLLYERDPVQGDSLVWEKDILGTDLVDRIPTLLLESGRTYAWQKIVYDTDGLSATTELRTFSTAFQVPDTVADLTATADAISSGVTLAWSVASGLGTLVWTTDPDEQVVVESAGAATILGVGLLLASLTPGGGTGEEDVTVDVTTIIDHYRVYWIDLAGNAIRIDGGPAAFEDGLTPLESETFTWYGARLGTNVFRVTAHNGALESVVAVVEVTLGAARPGDSMLATDGLARHTFPVGLDSAPRTRSPQIDVFRVPGGRTVHQVWGAGGRRVSARFTYIPSEDGDLATPLHELLDAGTPFWLKLTEPYKFDVMRVLLVDLRDEPVRNGLTTVQLDLDETSWR